MSREGVPPTPRREQPFSGGPPLEVLGLRLQDVTLETAVAQVVGLLQSPDASAVHFVNAHCSNVAARDASYRRALERARLLFADGSGMRWAARVLHGKGFHDNVNGTDMLPLLCQALEQSQHRLFLLGGRAGVARRAAEHLQSRFPRLHICGTHHGQGTPEQQALAADQVATSRADLLLVAMGVPLQELWIDRHQARSRARVAMGVGALFDFYSGDIARAPAPLRRHGLEWLWRLALEPRRLGARYLLGNPWFAARVLRERTRP